MKFFRGKAFRITAIIIIFALLSIFTYYAGRWVLTLRDPQVLADFQNTVHSLGFGGWLLLLGIQYIQIVIAFIPGGPIQIVAGALFGPLGGLLTCMLGILLATATVFPLVSRFGHSIINLFVGEKDRKNYKFLQDSSRLEFLVFVLFLIPGTPKDVLTYLFALTPIKMQRFLFISIIARVPAALTSTLMGDSIMEGNWLRALIFFIVMTAISIGGLFVHRKIMSSPGRNK